MGGSTVLGVAVTAPTPAQIWESGGGSFSPMGVEDTGTQNMRSSRATGHLDMCQTVDAHLASALGLPGTLFTVGLRS